MPYALFEDVQTRAGRFAATFSVAGARPNQADIDLLLVDVSAQIDSAIRARGHNPAGMAATARDALKDTAAYGALARALTGVPDSSDELKKLAQFALRVWGQAMGDPSSNTTAGQRGSIAAGTHPAVLELEAQGGSTAGAFWGDEPAFGTESQVEAERQQLTAELAPGWAKSQTL